MTINQKEQAKEILYKEILSSKAFAELIRSNTAAEAYKLNMIEKINNEYDIYLRAIGESSLLLIVIIGFTTYLGKKISQKQSF